MTRAERKLLEDCSTALNDWIVTYASEMCYPANVTTARKRIANGGGTLAYAADLRMRIKRELEK